MRRRYIKLMALAAAMLAVAGCIYPFTPEISETEGRLVVEGNIYIGEVSKFSMSYVSPLTGDGLTQIPEGSMWVEDSDGRTYRPVPGSSGPEFLIDLTEAPDDLKYRLHIVNNANSHEYASQWMGVAPAAVIDSLSYIPNEPMSRMDIALSMHSSGNSYFRWSYHETWEYHSRFYTFYYYVPPKRNTPSWNNGNGVIETYPGGENIYYCWGSKPSSEIMVFTTKDQTDDRFIDLEFHTIPRSDRRLQSLYYIEVYLEAISEDGYMYWNNVQKTSEYQGSIFSPNPSEMRGNIQGITDPDEFVTGYINVARRAVKDLYIDNYYTRFYLDDFSDYEEPVASRPNEWYNLSRDYYLPSGYDSNSGQYLWAPQKCVDCRLFGGTKNKPPFWPTPYI